MKTTWINFVWDLSKADLPNADMPKRYRIDAAGPEDHAETRTMIARAFALDPTWNSSLHEVNAMVENSISRVITSTTATATCMALRHGTRIIGGLFIALDQNEPEQLVPGPCVLVEYRNRGLGTLLLASALRQLRDAGIMRASVITRPGSPAARFLFPKFGGQPSPIVPLLAA